MATHTFRNIEAGLVLKVGYGGNLDKCEFLGFTDRNKQHSETPVYKNAKAMLKAEDCYSFADLEQKNKTFQHGWSIYAVFKDLENGDVFCAYLFIGRWCLGTSADRCQLESL
jgi:hypothetical protein